MDIVSELEDAAWASVQYNIESLGEEIAKAIGRKPTCNEFFELLSWALENTNLDIFEDVGPRAIARIAPVLHPQPQRIRPGTVMGIPLDASAWQPAVYLTSNTFGAAFGICEGVLSEPNISADWQPKAVSGHIYSELRPVREGRWKILAVRPDLLRLFPAEPEIYYDKRDYSDNPSIGPFGSAESPNGTLREISEAEAQSVGLISGQYQRVLSEDALVKHLQRNRAKK